MSVEIYVIVEIVEIRDPDALSEYQSKARAQLGTRGGVTIARGGQTVIGEPHGALLVQKWPDAKAFLDWQDSAEYKALKPIRERAARLRVTMVPHI